jgi:hypothetical protein
MKKTVFAIFLASFLYSCNGSDDPNPIIEGDGKFQVTVSGGYFSSFNETYLILHDLSGEPLATKQVTSEGQTLIFEIDDTKRYHLTSYRISENFGNRIEFMETYSDILTSEDVTLGLRHAGQPKLEVSGEFEVILTDTSLPFGAYVTSKGANYNYLANRSNGQLQMKMNTFKGESKYLLSATNASGQSRYKMLDVTSPGISTTLKFSELSTYDQVLKFPTSQFSQFYFSSISLEKNGDNLTNAYIVNSNRAGGSTGFDPTQNYEIGFLNNFENYQINIEAKRTMSSKTAFFYYRIGTAPASIVIPQEQEIQAQSKNLASFQFTKPAGTTDWIAVWDNSENTNSQPIKSLRWFVYGSNASVKIKLPAELTSSRPRLQNLSNFKLESINVKISSLEYDKTIRNLIGVTPKKEPIEIITIRQSF